MFLTCHRSITQILLSDTNQIIDNNQIPQIIYQQNTQQAPMQAADTQIHYIVQEDDLQGDNFNLVQQAAQQVYYQKVPTESDQQIIQRHGKCCFAWKNSGWGEFVYII